MAAAAAPVALQDAHSGPTPPTPPTAGKRSGDVPAEAAEGAAAAAAVAAVIVAARLPSDVIPQEQKGMRSGPHLMEQVVRLTSPGIPCGATLPLAARWHSLGRCPGPTATRAAPPRTPEGVCTRKALV